MKIKLTGLNPATLTQSTGRLGTELARVNGRASAHTATVASLAEAAEAAETTLDNLGLLRSQRAGARATYRSGGRVAQAYKYKRTVTVARLYRGATGWYVEHLTTADIYPNGSTGTWVSLLPSQHARLVADLLTRYSLQATAFAY